jgi:hypothetical protein
VVPVPVKEELRYAESQSLEEGSLSLRMLQTLILAQVRLTCAQKRLVPVAQESQLCNLMKLPEKEQPQHVREFDQVGLRASAERIGTWLGSSLSFSFIRKAHIPRRFF